jgi:hypothetical protein
MKEVPVFAHPVTVESSGPIDLATAKETFFNVTMQIMKDYLNANVGPILEEFNLKITFQKSQTEVQQVGVTGAAVLVKSFFRMEMEFKIACESVAILQEFTQRRATNLITGFFNGITRGKLLAELDSVGIRLESIRVVDSSAISDGSSDPETATTDEQTGQGQTGNVDISGSNEGGNDTNALLYAGLAGAGVVTLAAVVFCAQRRRNGWFDNAEDSIEQSLYSSGGHGPPGGKALPVLTQNGVSTTKTLKTLSLGSSQNSTRSRVKPAALTLRSKQNMKSQGSVSTLGSFNVILNPVLEKLGVEDDGSEEREDEEMALVRLAKGRDLAPASSRSNLFDGGAHTSNSTWSVDGLTIDDDSEAERIIEQARRRRWQDTSGASALGSLPDHSSEIGYYDENTMYFGGSASTRESLGPID